MKRKKISLADIADHFGVSLMTVSRALHGKFGVSGDTQRRIVAYAEKLGYIPSRDLYQLRDSKPSMTIGFVIPHLADTIFPQMFEAVESFFSERGWRVMMCCSYNSTIKEYRAMSSLLELGVDGVIWCPVDTDGYTHMREAVKKARKPVVFVDRVVPGFEADSVTVDDRASMKRLVAHLAERGCKRIAYLGAAGGASWVAKERKAGYLAALRAARLNREAELIVDVGSDFSSGVTGARTLFTAAHAPDAICCYNDPLALGAEKALLEMGVRIPEDCALTGFSDTVATSIAAVPVTTARQDAAAIGREAARLLHNRIISSRGKHFISKVLPTELVLRASTLGAGRQAAKARARARKSQALSPSRKKRS